MSGSDTNPDQPPNPRENQQDSTSFILFALSFLTLSDLNSRFYPEEAPSQQYPRVMNQAFILSVAVTLLTSESFFRVSRDFFSAAQRLAAIWFLEHTAPVRGEIEIYRPEGERNLTSIFDVICRAQVTQIAQHRVANAMLGELTSPHYSIIDYNDNDSDCESENPAESISGSGSDSDFNPDFAVSGRSGGGSAGAMDYPEDSEANPFSG